MVPKTTYTLGVHYDGCLFYGLSIAESICDEYKRFYDD